MARREGSSLVWQMADERLKLAVSEAFLLAPLPNPPLELPDFPAIPPSDAESLVRQAVGIFTIDRQGFNLRLTEVCDEHLPDYVKRSIDIEEAESLWLESNAAEVAERVLVLLARDWLAMALDEMSPDTDRWYLAASLIQGLALGGSEVARDGCYYLIEAIAYAVTPGNLPYSNVSGRHQLEWSQNRGTVDPFPPHPAGAMAATNILDTLSMRAESASEILPLWLENLSTSLQLCPALDVPTRVFDGLGQAEGDSCAPFVRAGLQMLSHSPDETRDILVASADHRSLSARRTVAEALPRIHSQERELALILADRLLLNDDLSVVILTSSFVGGLARLSEEEFVPRANTVLASGVERAVQRLVESGLRDHLSANPNDPHSMLVTAWLASSSVGRSRVGNLIAEQAGVAPDAFVETCSTISAEDVIAYQELLRWLEMRNPDSLELL